MCMQDSQGDQVLLMGVMLLLMGVMLLLMGLSNQKSILYNCTNLAGSPLVHQV